MICILSIREASIAFYVEIARRSQGTQNLNPDSDRVRKSGFNPYWISPLIIAIRKTLCGLVVLDLNTPSIPSLYNILVFNYSAPIVE